MKKGATKKGKRANQRRMIRNYSRNTGLITQPRYSTPNMRALMGPAPHHTIVVHVVVPYDSFNFATGYFDCAYVIKMATILTSSAFKGVIETYQKVRIRKYRVRTFNTGSSFNTPGRAAVHLYRDGVQSPSPRYFEQLLVEPGHKEGRVNVPMDITWLPIEPSDLEYLDISDTSVLNSGRFGTLMYSGVTTTVERTDIFKPSAEFWITCDLLNLRNPPPPGMPSDYEEVQPTYKAPPSVFGRFFTPS